ncbi:hypothetical protein EP331_04790 [bacterium]|nr:MAG: hypothetical protein EP331_04790 [bacterium]
MAQNELNDSEHESDSLFTSKSAATLSALFVLRKWFFNYYRYRKPTEERISIQTQLTTVNRDFSEAVRLLKQSLFSDSENAELEQYIFQIQIYDSLYKIHHLLLEIMPIELESVIPTLDKLLTAFHPDTNPHCEIHFADLALVSDFLKKLEN